LFQKRKLPIHNFFNVLNSVGCSLDNTIRFRLTFAENKQFLPIQMRKKRYFFVVKYFRIDSLLRLPSIGYVIGSIFTSLGLCEHALAPSLACAAYRRLLSSPTIDPKHAEIHAGLAFMALKAVPLPAVALCLDGVEGKTLCF
jgi:hypothetical protein